ncbi:MAG TPA: aminopeptidase P N-terminal domain-containing protein [Candidatus Acidoferrum sp.]|nr:aminopeptidase P N-terminal domain-containing protein [Candidatus Acidoferrum sp.]
MNAFVERRARVLEQLGDGVMILPATVPALRNNDTEYEYRADSDLYYLTGFTEPEAVLVLAPQRTNERVVLFLRRRDRALETWTGKRLGVEAAAETLGVEAAYPIEELTTRLPEYLVGASQAFARLGANEAFDRLVHAAVEGARGRTRRGGIAPSSFVDPGTILHELRLIKDAGEIETMRGAAAITRLGHLAGMRATRPGLHEYQLESIIESTYRMNGAQDVAYPSIVAGGANATILHYNTNRETLRDGDLVLVDSAAELDLYASDVTRTWPVGGRFSAEQRAIYEIVLAAQRAAIAQVRPGLHVRSAHEAAVRVLTEGLIELGLIAGSLDDAIATEAYRPFYMHGTGHWIGLDVHDVGAYFLPDGKTRRPLEPGMVITVEPGLYIAPDLECDARFKGIGVRIEDDILCGVEGPENLSPGIPKEIGEIEALVGTDELVHR